MRRQLYRLPDPDWDDDYLDLFAAFVLDIQSKKFAAQSSDVRQGTFTFLNRTVSFDGVEAVDWRREMGEGNNPLWRMNLSYMGYVVPLLATGREDDMAIVETLVETLETQNPWNRSGVFRDVWFPYAVSHRIINLLSGLVCWRRASGSAVPDRLTQHIKLCVEFLKRNLERELQFNHLLKNLVALKCYESAIAPSEAPRLVEETFLLDVLEQQLLPDGGHIERSPMYHVLYLEDLQLLKGLRTYGNEAIAALERVQDRALRALVHMTHVGNERIALMNDAWLGESLSPAYFLGSRETLPASSVQTLEDTGYSRINCSGVSLIFDCGAAGPDNNLGHAHADFLAVETMYHGIPFVVDPGTPIYTAGALRDWCRSSAIHNGPAIEGVEPLEFWKSFRVGRRGYAYPIDTSELPWSVACSAAGFQTGYRHVGCIAGRFIEVTSAGSVLVLDVWHLEDTDQVPISTWLISDLWAVAWEEGKLTMRNGSTALEWTFLNATHPPELSDSDYYEEFGVAKSGTRLRVRPRQSGRWCWVAVTAWDRAHPEPALRPHANKALGWVRERLTNQFSL
jgi:uncharacterized heparinase superfamily protein